MLIRPLMSKPSIFLSCFLMHHRCLRTRLATLSSCTISLWLSQLKITLLPRCLPVYMDILMRFFCNTRGYCICPYLTFYGVSSKSRCISSHIMNVLLRFRYHWIGIIPPSDSYLFNTIEKAALMPSGGFRLCSRPISALRLPHDVVGCAK